MNLIHFSLIAALFQFSYGQSEPFPNLVLQEVEFKDGNPGASSIYSTGYPASYAFSGTNKFWHSGKDSKGNGPNEVSFPHLIGTTFGVQSCPVVFHSGLD